ncbi:hypothetical protein Gohar_009148 [Gossypium harknessii]|uniref:Uncharacterized protein n=1 Tax=Gossypium harknessii TaxID=34285 RepID=A0A7J9GP56_9ROSI|nr:hypothetical protein [Gossypium harknessii]
MLGISSEYLQIWHGGYSTFCIPEQKWERGGKRCRQASKEVLAGERGCSCPWGAISCSCSCGRTVFKR